MNNKNLSESFLTRYKWLIISVGIVLTGFFVFIDILIKDSQNPKNVAIISNTSSISNPSSTDSYGTKDVERMDVITSLNDWDKLNYQGKISEHCYNFFFNLLSGKSEIKEYNTVIIKDYSIYYADSPVESICYLGFDFTVESSGLEELPAGKYHKIVRDIVDCYLTDTTGDEFEDRCGIFAGIEEVKMVNNWIALVIYGIALNMVRVNFLM